jgi:hypothetical protein
MAEGFHASIYKPSFLSQTLVKSLKADASLRAFCRILDWHCFSSNTRLRYSNAEPILIYG